MEADSSLHQQIPNAYRPLQPQAAQGIQNAHQHLGHHNLAQDGIDLSALSDNNAVFQYQSANPYDQSHGHRPMHAENNSSPHVPQQHGNGGQFGILTPGSFHNALGRLQHEDDVFGDAEGPYQKGNGHLNTKVVFDPPNLDEWRRKLFHVDEMITLCEEDFQTYFPHVDNVYSHRSTQHYKRKPFVSHYWDCRLKGRPPGTPKSNDPNKKKRKRTARERDLCDVKIKITEYFPGAMLRPDFVPDSNTSQQPNPEQNNNFFAPGQSGGQPLPSGFCVPMINNSLEANHPGANGQRYYTIQRVNGNGGNGKGDGIPGPHKHSLAKSDDVKKNSIQRLLAKRDKEDKKTQSSNHKRASGNALVTVKKHSKDHDLKFFGCCFSPFVQRVWIALEFKGIEYQYIEVDPYKKKQDLLEVNPRGLVPGIRHGDWACGDSIVLMEYLEDLGIGHWLLPQGNPQIRANCRFWSDHVNRKIIPEFYNLLQVQDYNKQAENTKKLQNEISKLVDACDPQGPFFLGPQMSYVDILFAPWMIQLTRVMKHYRGWPDPSPCSRWSQWMEAIENNEHVRNTTSLDELYLDSYERYTHSRLNLSDLPDFIHAVHELS